MASKPGGIMGLVIALLIVGGLAGTPFYLRMLQSEPRALDAAVAEDVEAVRRIVLNLDEHLAALYAMTASVADVGALPADEIERLSREEPDVVYGRQFLRELNQPVESMLRLDEIDAQRGTPILGKGTVDRRRPRPRNVISEFKSKYLKSHETMLRDAETALGRLRNVSCGTSSSANHLGANRIKAVYLLAKGRLQANKAQFERLYASQLRHAAMDRVSSLSELQRQASTLDAEAPAARMQDLEKQLQQTQAGLAAIQGALGQLGALVKSKQEQLDETVKSASEAQQALAQLGTQRLGFGEYSSRYLELSELARKAEAEEAALRYGTLRDAQLVEQSSADPTPPAYEGGTMAPGLEVLAFRLEELKSQQALLQQTQRELEKQRGVLNDLEQSLTTQKETVAKRIEEQSAQIKEYFTDSDAHEEKALKAEEDALKILKEAMRSAKDAVASAKKLISDAKQFANSGGNVDERLQRVGQDVDIEASMHCLVAETAYTMALLKSEHVAAGRERLQTSKWMATATGQEAAPPTSDFDKIQTEAANDVADALKAYEQAGTQIGKANLKLGAVAVSGKNYLWQVQVGQAAAHLLLAAIHADDADKARTEKTLAYNLLKDAAEKREQSPFLTPAVETVLYLQKTAQ